MGIFSWLFGKPEAPEPPTPYDHELVCNAELTEPMKRMLSSGIEQAWLKEFNEAYDAAKYKYSVEMQSSFAEHFIAGLNKFGIDSPKKLKAYCHARFIEDWVDAFNKMKTLLPY